MSVKCRVMKSGYCEITQEFGGSHIGIDIVNKGYTLGHVVAHSEGTVVMVQTGHKNNKGSTGNASYGNMVKIDHSNGCFTLYAHLSSVNVTNGQKVAKGQELGYMGDSGNAYGGHLHFEVWKNNTRVNPYEYLDKDLFETSNTNNELQKQVEQLKKEKQELIDKNKLLEQENLNLKEDESKYVLFTASKDGIYGINLKANETIKYEKD